MEILVNQKELLKGINRVKAATSKKVLPIFEGIIIEAKDNKINLFANDLEVGIDTNIPGTIEKPGEVVIPVKIFSDLVKKMKGCIKIQSSDKGDDEISFIVITDENDLVYEVEGFNPKHYPSYPKFNPIAKINISQGVLKKALNQVEFAAIKDKSRSFLNGIMFKREDGSNILELAATDAHRLSVKKIDISSSETIPLIDNNDIFEAIVPKDSVKKLIKLLSKEDDIVTITIGEKMIMFELDNKNNDRLYSVLIEALYPDYNQIIPKTFETEVITETKKLKEKLERAQLFDDKVEIFIFHDDVMSIKDTKNKNVSDLTNCIKTGENLSIGFNTQYLIDVLKVIDDERITIKLNEKLNPVTITPINHLDNYLYVVMPVRLDEED